MVHSAPALPGRMLLRTFPGIQQLPRRSHVNPSGGALDAREYRIQDLCNPPMRFQTSWFVIGAPFRIVGNPRASVSSISSKLRRSIFDARFPLSDADTSWTTIPRVESTWYLPKYALNSSCASGGLSRPSASLRRPLMSKLVKFPRSSQAIRPTAFGHGSILRPPQGGMQSCRERTTPTHQAKGIDRD